MPNIENAKRFETFARMRLEGRSDVTYRAYDLLSKERLHGNIIQYLRAAGKYVGSGHANMVIGSVQRQFIGWGYKISLGEVETLLHEFWVYNRIRYGGKKNWPYRDPNEARRLYDENEALALKDII